MNTPRPDPTDDVLNWETPFLTKALDAAVDGMTRDFIATAPAELREPPLTDDRARHMHMYALAGHIFDRLAATPDRRLIPSLLRYGTLALALTDPDPEVRR